MRIGRKLEKRIRPSFVAAQLKALQQRPERFNARQLLDWLFVLYESRARAEDPAWRPTRPGQGPLVSLADLYDLLTVLPAAGVDYPPEEFVAAIEEAVRSAKRQIERRHYVPQPPDFPVSRAEPAYLKTMWLQVV